MTTRDRPDIAYFPHGADVVSPCEQLMFILVVDAVVAGVLAGRAETQPMPQASVVA